MTLDEAIKHTEKIAENKENLTKIYKALNEDRLNEDGLSFGEEEKCAEEYRQLAEWLKDYKRLKEQESILDKIRAEIETKYGQCDICEYFEDYDYEENNISEYRPIGNIADILQIIDKYTAESEDK